MPWIRDFEVIVSPMSDPSVKSVLKDFRMDFEIRSTVGWPADTANITIYNLMLEDVKFLQSRSYGELLIEIRAGYVEDSRVGSTGGYTNYMSGEESGSTSIEISKRLPTIFSGVITNAVGVKVVPNHITNLFCISKAYGVATEFSQMRAIPKGTKLIDAIKSMCDDYGFETISSYGVETEVMETVLLRGRTFQGTFLEEFRKLLGEYNLLYTMTTGEIQIFPETYGNKDAVDRMSKDRGMVSLDTNSVIGNPVSGICTLSLNTFLNAAIQPGMVLDVTPLLGEKILVNGVIAVTGNEMVLNTDQSVFRWAMEDKYFITDVVHHGSTHTDTYQTSVTALIGGNTAMGQKEAAWQQTYLNSGMAMESF